MMYSPALYNPVELKPAPLSTRAKKILQTLKGADAHFVVREVLWQLGINSDLIDDVYAGRKKSPAGVAEMKAKVIPTGRSIVTGLDDAADTLNLCRAAMHQLGYDARHFTLIDMKK